MNDLTDFYRPAGEFLASQPEIDLAYIFGSVALGRTHVLSDIDVAILANMDRAVLPDTKEHYSYQTFLATSLMEIFHRSDVDLVLLHRAPPLLRFQVVRYGHILYCRNEHIRVQFEVNTRRDYLDTKPLRALQKKYLYQSIKAGHLGQERAKI